MRGVDSIVVFHFTASVDTSLKELEAYRGEVASELCISRLCSSCRFSWTENKDLKFMCSTLGGLPEPVVCETRSN